MPSFVTPRPEIKLFPIVENDTLQRIEDERGEKISSPRGVKLAPETEELIKHSKMLETVLSLEILDHPGGIAKHLDYYAASMAKLVNTVTTDENIGSLKVCFRNRERTLREAFTTAIFNPLSAQSDQVGRMPADSVGSVYCWLVEELNAPTSEDNFKCVLTKVKAISAFGSMVRQLILMGNETGFYALGTLYHAAGVGLSAEAIKDRFDLFMTKTRPLTFDDPITRARSERVPLIDGKPMKAGVYSDATNYGLGFGQMMQASTDPEETKKLRMLLDASGNRNSQINAIPRENAPIGNLDRPFMLSDNEFARVPAELRRKISFSRECAEALFQSRCGD